MSLNKTVFPQNCTENDVFLNAINGIIIIPAINIKIESSFTSRTLLFKASIACSFLLLSPFNCSIFSIALGIIEKLRAIIVNDEPIVTDNIVAIIPALYMVDSLSKSHT